MLTFLCLDRLLFLDNTLKGIIKRFEDEFPDTREYHHRNSVDDQPTTPDAEMPAIHLSTSQTSADLFQPGAGAGSDLDDEPFSIRPPLSRSNSIVSMSSRALAEEEGRVLRAGHKFRSGIVRPEHYWLLAAIDDVGSDPNHVRLLHELLDELEDADELRRKAAEVGVVRVFKEERATVLEKMKQSDPEHWERFAESQEMASKNRMNGGGGQNTEGGAAGKAAAAAAGDGKPAAVDDGVVVVD
jgi:hypothetical protein